MGQEASRPRPGTKLQVIGAGMPRTGTASLSKALEILLDGPIYHGGTQITRGPESEVPGMLFTEELLQMHPDVLVVCTVRDPDAWTESMRKTGNASLEAVLPFALFLVPTMRWFPRYIGIMTRTRWGEIFPHAEPLPDRGVWDTHQAWLKRVVPAERLVFYNVKDGWEPLCKALGKPVPSVPFPNINDGDAMEAFAKEQIMRGLTRWAAVFGSVTAAVGAWWWMH